MNNSMRLPFLLFISSVTSFAQSQTATCILHTAKDGQTITVRGKTVQQPHDLAFDIEGCTDLVVLTYAGDRDNDVNGDELRQDKNLKNFQKFTTSTYWSKGKNTCIQCMKHGNVEAMLTGKLQIEAIPPGTRKDQVGFLHDASGKIVGTSGFGHPSRSFKYRLVILSASDVKASKLPKPKP
jgi:hypothetical protein